MPKAYENDHDLWKHLQKNISNWGTLIRDDPGISKWSSSRVGKDFVDHEVLILASQALRDYDD